MSSTMKPWDYPDCPSCETEIYVDRGKRVKAFDFQCHKCGQHFNTES